MATKISKTQESLLVLSLSALSFVVINFLTEEKIMGSISTKMIMFMLSCVFSIWLSQILKSKKPKKLYSLEDLYDLEE